jgi:uncharacterized membrane protein
MEWKDIGQTIGKVAPMLGTLLAPATGGASIAIGALVSSVLGVENEPQAIADAIKNDPEALIKIKELEFKEQESLRSQVLELAKLESAKYDKAHDTYQSKNEMADEVAKQIIARNLPLIGILVVLNVAIVYFFKENATLIAIASNVIGISIGNLFAERQSIVNFFFGSSLGSKEKSMQINKRGSNNDNQA